MRWDAVNNRIFHYIQNFMSLCISDSSPCNQNEIIAIWHNMFSPHSIVDDPALGKVLLMNTSKGWHFQATNMLHLDLKSNMQPLFK